ncbi:MAG: hypothetical protein ACD_47C00470G0001 [uncultured bacterium]|nr:MAG: hypothetical protein ACD_47C00470G0001 [uncultured bacterium]
MDLEVLEHSGFSYYLFFFGNDETEVFFVELPVVDYGFGENVLDLARGHAQARLYHFFLKDLVYIEFQIIMLFDI